MWVVHQDSGDPDGLQDVLPLSGRLRILSFSVLLRCRGTGTVDKKDLPDARLFLQKGRFQPLLLDPARSVGDAALINVRNRIIKGRPFGVGYGQRKHHRPTRRRHPYEL
jgi:hypothetical protein